MLAEQIAKMSLLW